jgi:hypothetical protein
MEVLIRWRCSNCATHPSPACAQCNGSEYLEEWVPYETLLLCDLQKTTRGVIIDRRPRNG